MIKKIRIFKLICILLISSQAISNTVAFQYNLGNYSISLSGYTPQFQDKWQNININNKNIDVIGLNFKLSDSDKESLIIVQFNDSRWVNFMKNSPTEEDIINLWGLLTASAEKTFRVSIYQTVDLLRTDNPYPGLLILDNKTGIKGYGCVLSTRDVVLLISTSDDEEFSKMLKNFSIMPLNGSGFVRLEKIKLLSSN